MPGRVHACPKRETSSISLDPYGDCLHVGQSVGYPEGRLVADVLSVPWLATRFAKCPGETTRGSQIRSRPRQMLKTLWPCRSAVGMPIQMTGYGGLLWKPSAFKTC